MQIDVKILQSFLKDYKVAEKLKLSSQEVEAAFIENIQDELAIGHSIQDVTDNTLLLLFGMAEAEHIPTRTHFENVTDLYDELDKAIQKAIKQAHK